VKHTFYILLVYFQDAFTSKVILKKGVLKVICMMKQKAAKKHSNRKEFNPTMQNHSGQYEVDAILEPRKNE